MTDDELTYEEAKAAAKRHDLVIGWARVAMGVLGMILVAEAVVWMFVVGGPLGWVLGLLSLVWAVAACYSVWSCWWVRPFEHGGWTVYDIDNKHHVQQMSEQVAQQIIDGAREEGG